MKILKKEAVYLGAPLFLTRSTTKDFKFLLDKLETKLMGWRSKCLSWAGRSTLISSVAQAIPNYSVSYFNIPAKICNKLDSTSRRFWWKPKASVGRFIAWNSWDKLCQPISLGGLRFKKAKDFNNAMLAKLDWMVASKRDSICMAVVRAKYKVKHDWLYSDPPKSASPSWRAIEKAKQLIVKGACYIIGDGQSINIWSDPCMPQLQGFKPV